jgi:hypothetical protein
MEFEELIRAKGKCCITGKPLSDSKNINVVMLENKATWQYPSAGNVITGESGKATAIVHDDCIKNGEIDGEILYAIEIKNGSIIYHPVLELEPF